jgi:Fe-Mn family superoxide dismutase
MAYTVPPLPYPFDALEPYIDAKTMEIHHDKHHKAYVDNLNKAIDGTELGNQPVESLIANLASVPEKIRTAVQNNGGGHANHSLFWTVMGKGKGGKPSGAVAEAINKDLGGFEQFTKDFTQNALTQFGSGWSWLYIDNATGKLALGKTPNQDSPLMKGNTPILGIDVWEHAYYLKYQNRRPDYVAQFFNVIDWDAVAARFAAAKKR